MERIFRAFVGSAGFRTARVFENGTVSKLYGEFLCDALESDMQSAETCSEHINSVLDVLAGKMSATEWAGNAYEIDVTSDIAVFSNELTGEKGGEIPTFEYLSALLLWKRFLADPASPVEGRIADDKEAAIRLAGASF